MRCSIGSAGHIVKNDKKQEKSERSPVERGVRPPSFDDWIYGCNLILYHNHGCCVTDQNRDKYIEYFKEGKTEEEAVKLDQGA